MKKYTSIKSSKAVQNDSDVFHDIWSIFFSANQ